ncbi:MAG: hypothetical protein ACJATU_000437 [Rickettsiales bacterium]|jgi:hypothetical protein
MLEKFFDRSFVFILLVIFLVGSAFYNVGYFTIAGGSLSYFSHMPITFLDIIKTGFGVLIPLVLLLMIFKPILIDPAFKREFPTAPLLLVMAVAVFVTNFLYFAVFIYSPNQALSIISEMAFYIFALICLLTVVYYFSSSWGAEILVTIFFFSIIPLTFLIGVADAKFDTSTRYYESKTRILLGSDKVVRANVLRSFEKGVFVIMDKSGNVNFIPWNEIKAIKVSR